MKNKNKNKKGITTSSNAAVPDNGKRLGERG
jgi:hypothetical protein